MVGSNELHLCEAELCTAMQTYLNGHVLTKEHCVKVVSVKIASVGAHTKTFVVAVEHLEPEESDTGGQ
jgi:hypothetical protein